MNATAISLQLVLWLLRYCAAALSPYLAMWTKHVTASSTCTRKKSKHCIMQFHSRSGIHAHLAMKTQNTQWHEAHTSGRSMSSPFSSSFLSSIAIWMGSSATLRLVSRRLRFWLKTAENEEQVHTLMTSVNMFSLFAIATCTGSTYCCYEESTLLLQIFLNCLLHLIEIWQLVAQILGA